MKFVYLNLPPRWKLNSRLNRMLAIAVSDLVLYVNEGSTGRR